MLEKATLTAKKGSDTGAELYSELPLNAQSQLGRDSCQRQSLAKELAADDERPKNLVANWLLNTPLGMNSSRVAEWKSPPKFSNLSSQPSYTSSVPALCVDCGEDHSSLSMSLYDASSSYTYAHSRPINL
jgi:hypothetical protein